MKRGIITAIAVGLIAGAAAWFFLAPRTTPSGQPPLVTLNDAGIGPVIEWFNSYIESPRVILMLSPT